MIMPSFFFVNRTSICSPDKSILLQAVVFSRLIAATVSQADFMVLILKWLFDERVTHKDGRCITIFPPTCMCAAFPASLKNSSLLLFVVSFLGIWRLQYCVSEIQLWRTVNDFICRIPLVWIEDANI